MATEEAIVQTPGADETVGGSLLTSFFPARTTLAALLEPPSIIALAGSSSGYDHIAGATQAVRAALGLTSSVRVENVPRDGGAIGLAPFVTSQSRGTNLIVAARLSGAIKIKNFPVTMDQVTLGAQLAGEYQLLIVSENSKVKSVDDRQPRSRTVPGWCPWECPRSTVLSVSASSKTVTAFRGGLKTMNYIVAGTGGDMLAQIMGNYTVVVIRRYNIFVVTWRFAG